MRLVLIDGHAILHRAYHALPPLTTSKGQLVNAVFGFTSMLLRVISDLKPTHLIVTFDRPKPTFRNKMYAGYQAKRPKMQEELASQIDVVHKVVSQMNIPIYEMDAYEADDLIGTIAKKAMLTVEDRRSKVGVEDRSLKIDTEVIIVTGDRDILQLVSDKVKVYMPVKGLSESKLYGEKEVEEKFGIKPAQMVDYKALVGDQSDNYPGVPGIGPKTASFLLSYFKTLEQIYAHLDKIESEKVRQVLVKNRDAAELAKKLAAIVTDIPLDVDLEKCRLQNLDRPNIHQLFEELEFRSLIPRLTSGNKEQRTKNRGQNKKDNTGNTGQIKLF